MRVLPPPNGRRKMESEKQNKKKPEQKRRKESNKIRKVMAFSKWNEMTVAKNFSVHFYLLYAYRFFYSLPFVSNHANDMNKLYECGQAKKN